jgi:hypothetical protein
MDAVSYFHFPEQLPKLCVEVVFVSRLSDD